MRTDGLGASLERTFNSPLPPPQGQKLRNPTPSIMTKTAFLVVQRGPALLDVVELPEQGRVTIGRAHTNRIVLEDSKCSRQHCEVFWRNGGWVVRDLNSRNGVLLDGEKIEGDRSLQFGHDLTIGDFKLILTDNPERLRDAGRSAPPPEAREPAFAITDRKSGTQYDAASALRKIQDSEDQATGLFRLARTMATCQTESELCHVVLDGLVTQSGATLGGILLVPEGDPGVSPDRLVPGAVVGVRSVTEFSTFLTQIVLRDQDAILAHDIPGNSSLSSQDSLSGLNAESAICAPVRHSAKLFGVIHLYSINGGNGLTQTDLEFVLAVADQMGDQLVSLRERAKLEVGLDRARRHVSDLQDQLRVETELVGNSPRMEDLRRSIARIAPTDALVLIRGESGVGKELVARGVHFNSKRKDGPFVCVNCAALSESLLESELFGHEKGAFTGAAARRAGKFEQASGGTLFLDEIGEMSPEVQAKFLRVLEGQAFERVGGGEAITVDVRVVTATNRDLEEAVRQNRLRRDLFFRLQVIEIEVPALRTHREDIPSIAQHFLQKFAAQSHRRVRGFTQSALQKLQFHDWPGNVRELRNVVERAVILTEHEYLSADDLALTKLRLDADDSLPMNRVPVMEEVLPTMVNLSEADIFERYIRQNTTLDDMDRIYIEAVLKSTYWNKSKASRILQIERTTLDRRLKKYGLARPGSFGDEEDSDLESGTDLPMDSERPL